MIDDRRTDPARARWWSTAALALAVLAAGCTDTGDATPASTSPPDRDERRPTTSAGTPDEPVVGGPSVTVERHDPSATFVAGARLVDQHRVTVADDAALADCPLDPERREGTLLAVVELGLVNDGPGTQVAPRVEVSFRVESDQVDELWWVSADDGDRAGVVSVGVPADERVTCVADVLDVGDVDVVPPFSTYTLGQAPMAAGEHHRATVLVIVPADSGALELGAQVWDSVGGTSRENYQQIPLLTLE